MPTLAEQWVQQGREEGRHEGRQEGHHEGRKEGRHEGRQEGELIGRIRVYQEMLGTQVNDADELDQLDMAALERLAQDLKNRLAH